MKCHIADNEIRQHHIIAQGSTFIECCQYISHLLNATDHWRNDPTYLSVCSQGDTRPVYTLSDLSFHFDPPTTWRNFDSIEEARKHVVRKQPSSRSITCLMTGESYPTITHAAERHNISVPTVSKSLKTGAAVHSNLLHTHTWFALPHSPPPQPPLDQRVSSVLCVTTGEMYPSMSDAAAAHDLHISALSRAIRTGKTVRGYEWKKT